MNIDPTLIAAATATLEQGINRTLQFDPATRQAITMLAGKSLLVEITEPALTLCLNFTADNVRVTSCGEDATTRLRGPLYGLLQLALSDNVNLSDSGVEVWGSTSLLADLQRITGQLDIDWEDAISPWLGDVASHALANHLRAQLNWVGERGRNGKRLLQEFLTEELRATPHRLELESFNREVDQLRLAADRVQSRGERIKSKLNQPR
jgi:ubiquinone biosynthesis protein UbiJ